MMKIGIGEKFLVVAILLCVLACTCSYALTFSVFAVVLALSIMQRKRSITLWKRYNVPGPEPSMLTANTAQVFKYGQMKVDIENGKKYGDFYGVYILGRPFIVVSDLTLLRQLLVKDFKSFNNRPEAPIFDGKNNLLHHILFALRSQRWKEVRTVLTPNFTTGRLKYVFPTLIDCSSIAVEVTKNSMENGKSRFNTRKIIGNIIVDLIAKSAFGVNSDFQHHDGNLFVKMASKVFELPPFHPLNIFIIAFPNLADVIRTVFNREIINDDVNTYFKNVVKQAITERVNNPANRRNDFLQMVIETSAYANQIHADNIFKTDENNNDHATSKKKVELTEIELIAQCFVFIVAGYETTTTTLQCAFYSLAVNPEVQERAYEEVVQVLGDKENFDYEDLNKLEYVGQVIMETLRMYPPVGSFRRECNEDIVFNNIQLRRGYCVKVPVFAIHYDERYYEKPRTFNPDRFEASEIKNRDPLAFCPFGHGPRQCIGMRLALQNAKTIIAMMLRRYKFSTTEYAEGSMLDIKSYNVTRLIEPVVLDVECR